MGDNCCPTVLIVEGNSPAAKAGIQKYDMITKIDNVPVVNKPLIQVMRVLCGDPGTTVILEIKRLDKECAFIECVYMQKDGFVCTKYIHAARR